MKTEDFINEIIIRAEEFCGTKPHVLRDKISIMISKNKGEEIISYINETYFVNVVKTDKNYKSLTLCGFELLLSETLKDDDIFIGIKYKTKP